MGKIKFKLSVKELSFEFEGDQETGQRFQNSISKTLNSLTDTPNHIIDVEARTVEDNFLLPAAQNSTKPKRKRGKRNKAIDADSLSSENGFDNGNGEKVKRSNRPKGQSARDQIVVLLQSGYFAEYRSVADIQDALSKKGHNFDSGEISPSLLRLTQKDHLVRDDSSGKWQYKKGAVDVSTES